MSDITDTQAQSAIERVVKKAKELNFSTGYFGCDIAVVKPGHVVVVGGCGPVGLMTQMSALLRGAAHVYATDRVPARLELARKISAIPINVDKEDPVRRIMDDTDGWGADACVEAVGYEATGKGNNSPGPKVEAKPLVVLETLIKVAKKGKRGAIIGRPGLFAPTPADPEAGRPVHCQHAPGTVGEAPGALRAVRPTRRRHHQGAPEALDLPRSASRTSPLGPAPSNRPPVSVPRRRRGTAPRRP